MAIATFYPLVVVAILAQTLVSASYDDKFRCNDRDTTCRTRAARGECVTNEEYMNEYCRLSCGLCERSSIRNILQLADAQTSYFIWMLCLFLIGFALAMVKVYCAGGVCRSTRKLDGKVAIVTGANSGLGYYTALDLAWRKARVILACRNFKEGLRAMKKIQTLSRNPDVEVKKLDLASFLSVRNFAEDIIREEKSVDILVNNAGILPDWERKVTEDGCEQCFQVNYLSPFLLTNLLLPKMKQGASTDKRRIVNVSSFCYRQAESLAFDNLQGEKSYGAWSAYKRSKLAVQLHTYELSKRLKNSNVIVNAVHPGISMTNIHRNWTFLGKWLFFIMLSPVLSLFSKSPRQAAQTTLHCCVAESVENINGGYFEDCTYVEPDPVTLDDAVAEKMWEVSARLVKL